jgi:hypothetical protein
MGRPNKLTEEAIRRYLQAVSAGSPPESAARYAGWSPAAYYRYLKGSTPAHAAFRERAIAAATELEVRLAGTLYLAALTDPKWALVMLERRYASHWRRPADEAPAAAAGRAQITRTETVELPLDPALIEALVPRLLEAGGRLRDGSDAVDLRRFDTSPRQPADPEESSR